MLRNQLDGKIRHQVAVCVTHTHDRLVDVKSLGRESTELVSVHDVIIGLFRIKVLNTRLVGGKRRDTISQTFLNEVVTKVHVILCTYSHCHINRTCPVTLRNHLKHHQITFVKCTLASKRYHHPIRNSVTRHHHSTLADSLLINGHVNGICRDEMLVGIL